MRSVLAPLALALALAPPASAEPKKNPRVLCGCPSPRLLGKGPVVLDDKTALPAWLHDEARLEAFRQDEVNKQKLTGVDAPIVVEEFNAFPDGRRVPTTSRLVRVHATAPLEAGTFVGVLRRTDTAPRDVIAVSGPGSAEVPATGVAPQVKALWLAPLEQRDRPGCGTWVTHKIAFELAEGSPAPEAFVVTDDATGTVGLVDARYAGAFGLGRVDVCEQGMPFVAGVATEIEVRPVSSTFGVGEPWRFHSDGTGTTDLGRTASPASADPARIAEPFPIPGADDLRGPTTKEIAAAVMGTVAGGAALVALFAFVIIPARKRRMKDITCPSCGNGIPVDTLDKKTDGFFCPSCGASGFWRDGKGELSATPLPKA
jgi:predicted RNA-binding Zn-ribbon protein involved in translation (DUF1610 family)